MATYDALIEDLIGKAGNAAARNKPTMWAYYLDVAEGLMDWFAESDRTDEAYGDAAAALTGHAAASAPKLNAPDAARLWALGVYARRILRASGHVVARVSLDWLHERARVLA